MNNYKIVLLIFAISLITCKKKSSTEEAPPKEETKITPQPVQEIAIAFPGAEGYGKIASGGRGGKNYIPYYSRIKPF